MLFCWFAHTAFAFADGDVLSDGAELGVTTEINHKSCVGKILRSQMTSPAKKAGKCSIYAYAQNGIFVKIKLTVIK